MLRMDVDLREDLATEPQPNHAQHDRPESIPEISGPIDTEPQSGSQASWGGLLRWPVKVWCVAGALCVAYMFSYLAAATDYGLRAILFIAVGIGLSMIFCGLADEVDRIRGRFKAE